MFSFKKEVWLLIAFSALCTFGVSSVFPYIPIHGKEIGIPVTIIGQLVVLYYLLQSVTRIPLGKLSDTIGHHKPVLIGAVFFILSSLAFVFSAKLWFLLFLGEFFLGIANSITWVTIPSYITNVDRALPVYTFTMGLGWLLGSPVGGYIKDGLGMNWVFLTLLFVSVGLFILSAVFYHFETKQREIEEPDKSLFDLIKFAPQGVQLYPSLKSYVDAWRLLKTNRPLLIASSFSFLVFMAFGLGASILPLYFSKVGISSFFIGILISTRTAASTSIRLASDRFTKRFSEMIILVVGTALAGISMIIISQVQHFYLLAILSAAWGLFSGFYLPVTFKIIGDNTDLEERGIAMGIRGTMGTFGAALGTWVFSGVADSFSLETSLMFAGIITVVGSILLGLLKE